MRLRDFSFLADENIHREVTAHLRAQGFDVLQIAQSDMAGSDDADLLKLAVSQNRVVLTHDRDFGALSVARLEPTVGIVYLRPGHIEPGFTIQTIVTLFTAELDLTPPFLLVARRSGHTLTIRVRRL